jgi:hypothetical protein
MDEKSCKTMPTVWVQEGKPKAFNGMMDPGHLLQLCQSIDTVVKVLNEANVITEL